MADVPLFDKLLEEVLDLSDKERAEYLRANCDDPELIRRIEDLMSAETQITDSPALLLLDLDPSDDETLDRDPMDRRSRRRPEIRQIGPYKIVRVLGEGGMGVVYLAEQKEPVERQLALKLVKPELLTPRKALRLAAERQALAHFSHPNIAQLYDAGTTEDGSPFFAMELIEGDPVTEYCRKGRLSVDQRLKIFLEICRGVHHAHQKGIIHRDLKPSNILVTEIEGDPVPKIIDFGIAKGLDHSLTDKVTPKTAFFVGTPGYISPESAILEEASDPDIRSDVYSLGALLYQLLAGRLPIDAEGVPIGILMQRLQHEEPLALSERLKNFDEAERSSLGLELGIKGEDLVHRLSGELEWIVDKAVARRREDRYDSVAELAADVERYFAHEPLSVGPPAIGYRLRKLALRHRFAVSAVVMALLALTMGAMGLTYGLLQAHHEKNRAEMAESRALSQAETVEEVVEFMVDLFESSNPAESRGENVTARELLDRGTSRIQDELQERPRIQARVMEALARVQFNLANFDDSEELASGAIGFYQTDPELFIEEQTSTEVLLATNFWKLGRLDESIDVLREALSRDSVLEHNAELHFEVLSNLGRVLSEKGNYELAEQKYGEALSLAENAFGDESREVSRILSSLAGLHGYKGRYAEAEALLTRSLELQERLMGKDHPSLMPTLINLGLVLVNQGELEEGRRIQERALDLGKQMLGLENPLVRSLLSNMGYQAYLRGAHQEAVEYLEDVVALEQREGQETLGAAARFTNYGLALWRLGRGEEAIPLFQKATEIRRKILAPSHPHRATSLWGLANVYRDQGRYADAEPLYVEALKIRREALPLEHREVQDAFQEYAAFLRLTGRSDEADQLDAEKGGRSLESE